MVIPSVIIEHTCSIGLKLKEKTILFGQQKHFINIKFFHLKNRDLESLESSK